MYQSREELLDAAQRLAGLSIRELATKLDILPPPNLNRQKGWMGQLIELALNVTAGSKPIPDFPELGIELKTIPIDRSFNPLESTYICTAPLMFTHDIQWETSHLRNKISEILWLPIIGDKKELFLNKTIGTAILWTPNEIEMEILEKDWNEIMEYIAEGKIATISARFGLALQLRPKAANGQSLTTAIGSKGELIRTRPRGFYLRTSFTKKIIGSHFDKI